MRQYAALKDFKMALSFSASLRTARAAAITAALDAASPTPGYIEFYNGSRPGTGVAVTSQTLLGTITLGLPSSTASNGVLTFTTTTQDLYVDSDGTITWARISDGSGGFVMDASCGLSGSGADFIFNSVDALEGGILKLNSGAITEGGV